MEFSVRYCGVRGCTGGEISRRTPGRYDRDMPASPKTRGPRETLGVWGVKVRGGRGRRGHRGPARECQGLQPLLVALGGVG